MDGFISLSWSSLSKIGIRPWKFQISTSSHTGDLGHLLAEWKFNGIATFGLENSNRLSKAWNLSFFLRRIYEQSMRKGIPLRVNCSGLKWRGFDQAEQCNVNECAWTKVFRWKWLQVETFEVKMKTQWSNHWNILPVIYLKPQKLKRSTSIFWAGNLSIPFSTFHGPSRWEKRVNSFFANPARKPPLVKPWAATKDWSSDLKIDSCKV